MEEPDFDRIRRMINKLIEEVRQLSEQDLQPPEFFGKFLPNVLSGLSAPAGAIWLRNTQGHLQLQYQVNLHLAGLEGNEQARQSHDELLRQAFGKAQPAIHMPHSGVGPAEGGALGPGNPTDYIAFLVPIIVDRQCAGILEVLQDPAHSPDAFKGFQNYLMSMAVHASAFMRNLQLRQLFSQQQVWTQLEAFSRQVHASLSPTEVAFVIANEGRRLIHCDRVGVAVRLGKQTLVEAVSGVDVVERRSNLVKLMTQLAEKVSAWGERLVFRGKREEGLPAPVLHALDEYLSESASKVLVVLPLRDERETDTKKPPRTVLVMEAFDPDVAPEQLVARMEVVGRHAAAALYNATEYKRIPFRWVWLPLARIQEGLGGKARTIAWCVGGGALLLLLLMLFVPYPLKMDATGQLLPQERRWIYSPLAGRVVHFAPDVNPGSPVAENQSLMLMHDVNLESKFRDLQAEIDGFQAEINGLGQQASAAVNPIDRAKVQAEQTTKESLLQRKKGELTSLRQRINAVPENPGYFWLKSPLHGTVLNENFRENLTHRMIKPSEPLLRIGDKDGPWEIELKIPQRHIGQILQAFDPMKPEMELDVDLLLRSAPTQTFRGRLARRQIGGEAKPEQNEIGQSEPVVIAWVRIHGLDIPDDSRVPNDLLLAGTEVHAKVRCGPRRMIYSLFYGVWEFFYEKIVFFF